MIEISPENLHLQLNNYTLVDVREPHELIGPEGQIAGIILAPLGPALLRFLETADPTQTYAFICRSGIRSAQACELARAYGFENVYNLKGGMLAWNTILLSNNEQEDEVRCAERIEIREHTESEV